MLPWVVCQQRSSAKKKLPESKYLEPESGTPESGTIFPGVGAGAGTMGTLNSGPEPEPGTECFPGTGAGAVQFFFRLRGGDRGFANTPPVIVLNNLKLKANKRQSRNILPGESAGVAQIL